MNDQYQKPAAGVSPAVPRTEGTEFCYRVTPQQRYEAARTTVQRIELERVVDGCKDEDGQGLNTINTWFRVCVKELVFPGREGDEEEIEDKWVYVFHGTELYMKAHALNQYQWLCTYRNGDSLKEEPSQGTVDLDPGPMGERRSYRFFLSPVELTQQAIDSLTTDQSRLQEAMIEASYEGMREVVLVPDPFRWAADANLKFYMDRVRAYFDWAANETRHHELFIACTLKDWLGENDPRDIKKQIAEGQPQMHLDNDLADQRDLLKGVEEAGAYVAHCIDSPEYRAIETACLARGGEDLALFVHAFACGLEGIMFSPPMQALGARLVADPHRFPSKFVFADSAMPMEQIFKTDRQAFRAAVKVAQELTAPMVNKLHKEGAATLQFQWRDRLELLDDGPLGITDSQRFNHYLGIQRSVLLPLNALVELTNFYFEARKSIEKGALTPAAASAEMKLVSELAKASTLLIDAPWYVGTVEKTTPILAMVSGAIDFFVYTSQAADAQRRSNYGAFVANEAMATGVGLTAIMSALTVIGKLAPVSAAGGLPGMAVWIIGAALVGAGAAIRALCEWFRRNQLQAFAYRCFLGKGCNENSTEDVELLPRKLPTSDRSLEAQTLLEILAGFQVDLESSSKHASDWCLRIYPGFYLPESFYEILLERAFTETMRSLTILRVYPDSGRFEAVTRPTLKADRHNVTRELPWFKTSSAPGAGTPTRQPPTHKSRPPVSRIDISLENESGPTYAGGLGSWRAFIRFQLNSSIDVPPTGKETRAMCFDITKNQEIRGVWQKEHWTQWASK